MSDGFGARRHRMSPRDRQMLAGTYLPVIAFAAMLITARISRTGRNPLQAALR
jgi:hypothetical protein